MTLALQPLHPRARALQQILERGHLHLERLVIGLLQQSRTHFHEEIADGNLLGLQVRDPLGDGAFFVVVH